MKLIISDIETNRLEKPDKMWLFGGRDHKTGEKYQFEPFRGEKERLAAIEWAESVDMWVGHNFISFDAAQCNRMLKPKLIDPTKVIDTLIVSRLVQYDRPTPKGCRSGHSLKAHGIRLGCHKGDFDHFEDFLDYWDEGVEYWKGDIDTTEALFDNFKQYIYDPDWKSAMRVEHDTQIEMERQKYYGFDFDKDSAQNILSSVTERMKTLEEGFAEQFPPKLVVVNELNYLIKKDGEKGVHVINAEAKYPLTQVEDGKLICYDYKPFKPGSPQDRIDVLWEAGWKPFEKTKTAQKFGRLRVGDGYGKNNVPMTQEFYDEKKKRLETYGWVCNEDNLATLPDDAPQGARDLAQWLTLEGRRSSLVEWIDQVGPDGRIHGNVLHIGAWTGRCSHNNPNTANISAPFHGKVKTAVDQVKNDYDAKMRALWRVPEGSWLVGVDAEGIQLRILGDWLWRHYGERSYADTIVNGRKEDETDIHNVNRRALSLEHLTRDHAKTFNF